MIKPKLILIMAIYNYYIADTNSNNDEYGNSDLGGGGSQ